MEDMRDATCELTATDVRPSNMDEPMVTVSSNYAPVAAQDDGAKVDTDVQQTSSDTVLKLKTFIRRNLQQHDDSNNPHTSSNECVESQDLERNAQSTGSANGEVPTPEPTPLTTSNVTLHDKIWCKGSPETTRADTPLSPPLKFLTVPSTEKVWRARHNLVDTLSDTESDQSFSSQDTMIMMTTDECKRNQMRIVESQTRYMMLKQARDNGMTAATVREELNASTARDVRSATTAHDGPNGAAACEGLSATAVRRRRLSKTIKQSDIMASSQFDKQVMSDRSRVTLPNAVEMLQRYGADQRNASWYESRNSDCGDQSDMQRACRSSIVRQNATVQEDESFAQAYQAVSGDNGHRPEHVEDEFPTNNFHNGIVGGADVMIEDVANQVLEEDENEVGNDAELVGNDEHSDDGYESTDTANSAETNSSSSSSHTNYDSPPPVIPIIHMAEIANDDLDTVEPQRLSQKTKNRRDAKHTPDNDTRPTPAGAGNIVRNKMQAAVRRSDCRNQRRPEENSLEETLKKLTIMENDCVTQAAVERDDVTNGVLQSYGKLNKNRCLNNSMGTTAVHQNEHKLFYRGNVKYDPCDYDVRQHDGKEPSVQQDLFISPQYYVQHILERQKIHPERIATEMHKCEKTVSGCPQYRENMWKEATITLKDNSKKHRDFRTWSVEPHTAERQYHTSSNSIALASYPAQPRVLEDLNVITNEPVTKQASEHPGGNYVHAEKVYAVLKRQGILQVGVATARVMESGSQHSPGGGRFIPGPTEQQDQRLTVPKFSQKVSETACQLTQVTSQTLRRDNDQLYSNHQSKHQADFQESQNEQYGRSIQLIRATESTPTANKSLCQPSVFPAVNTSSDITENRYEHVINVSTVHNSTRPRFGTTAELCQMMKAQLKQPSPAPCHYPAEWPKQPDAPASYQNPLIQSRRVDASASLQYSMPQTGQPMAPALHQYSVPDAQSAGYYSRPVYQNAESRQDQELRGTTQRQKPVSERESGKYFQFCFSQRYLSHFAEGHEQADETHKNYGHHAALDRHRDAKRDARNLVQPYVSRNYSNVHMDIPESYFQNPKPTFGRDLRTEKYPPKPPKSQYV